MSAKLVLNNELLRLERGLAAARELLESLTKQREDARRAVALWKGERDEILAAMSALDDAERRARLEGLMPQAADRSGSGPRAGTSQ